MLIKLHNASSILLKTNPAEATTKASKISTTVLVFMSVFDATIFANIVPPPADAPPLNINPNPIPIITPP